MSEALKTQPGSLEVIHTRDGQFMVGYSNTDEAGGFTVIGDITAKVPFIVECAAPDEPANGMNFGQAIAALKAGHRVARAGWNGKGMWIVYMSGMSLPPYSTQGTDRKVNDRTARWIGEDTPLETLPYIAMWTADKKWLPGWLASQTDMLADDWCAVEG